MVGLWQLDDNGTPLGPWFAGGYGSAGGARTTGSVPQTNVTDSHGLGTDGVTILSRWEEVHKYRACTSTVPATSAPPEPDQKWPLHVTASTSSARMCSVKVEFVCQDPKARRRMRERAS